LLILLVAGAIAWLATRAHKGGTPAAHHLTPPTHVAPVKLTAATAYNPDGLGGDITQDNQNAHLAIDGNSTTGWATEQYYSGSLQKPGVGIYVTAPHVAAQKLTLLTPTGGWSAQIYGTNTPPNLSSFADSHWVLLASTASTGTTQDFTLASGAHANRAPYTYYLVWITKLPPQQQSVQINEIRLYAPRAAP